MATEAAPTKCAAALFSVTAFLLFLGGETLKLRLEGDAYDPRKHAVDDPEEVVRMFNMATTNSTERRKLGQECPTLNPMDACWLHYKDSNWRHHRMRMASCGLGFGSNAIGGLYGRFYYVNNDGDDPVNPVFGTLRYGAIQDEPLWIVFTRHMVIRLKQELMINSFKTIDGRGQIVNITGGAGLTLQYVHNIIITGLTIGDIIPTGNAMVRDTPRHYGWRTLADGDGVSLFGASRVWIDHNTLYNCADGLVDAIMGSTAITISNNLFLHHNEVMLLGHSDAYVADKTMQVTIAFNHFGEGLIQRMPRCRHGYFHVVNNDYTHWEMYAIGGSANPTINSQGNRFLAPYDHNTKEVTKRVLWTQSEWSLWNWRSDGDLLLNGAFFVASGTQASSVYARASSTKAKPASLVRCLTKHAGAFLFGRRVR